jgi:hypothetical protein
LLARISTFTDHYDFEKAKDYYEKSIQNFVAVEHYRGAYLTYKELHDLYDMERL